MQFACVSLWPQQGESSSLMSHLSSWQLLLCYLVTLPESLPSHLKRAMLEHAISWHGMGPCTAQGEPLGTRRCLPGGGLGFGTSCG